MSNQVIWTKAAVDNFILLGNLSDEEAYLIRTRRKKSRVQQSFDLNCSVSRIDKMISDLKTKYDAAQRQHPECLAPRVPSKRFLS